MWNFVGSFVLCTKCLTLSSSYSFATDQHLKHRVLGPPASRARVLPVALAGALGIELSPPLSVPLSRDKAGEKGEVIVPSVHRRRGRVFPSPPSAALAAGG